ncbi:hypothetical protein [Streptosporangium sp. V21-05]|uniref:hypothetical protein n=1 Tax=Streptosporangium sp. V21-05 TaxID=3446115 RepID=UPI003F53100D
MFEVPGWAREAAGRFLEAGWWESDVLYALDNRPDGTPWLYNPFPYGTGDWAQYRLAGWLDGHGRPIMPRSAVLEQHARQLRKQQQRQRRHWAVMVANASAKPVQAAQWARFVLGMASPRAAAVILARQRAAPQRAERDVEAEKLRWNQADEAAQAVLDAALSPVERWSPPPPQQELDPRMVSLVRARERARRERRQQR